MGSTMTDQIDRAIDDTRAFLAESPTPDVTAAVMSQIAHLEPLPAPRRSGVLRRMANALWVPREFSIRPAFGLGAAAAIVTLLLVPYAANDSTGVSSTASGRAPQVFVQFRLEAMASRVQLAGSFTNWEPRYELRQSVPGVWSITVPLTEGVHDYAFVVDGQQWVADPYAPQIGDGFGGTNNRLALLPPDTPQL
jgi:hypothetical protein